MPSIYMELLSDRDVLFDQYWASGHGKAALLYRRVYARLCCMIGLGDLRDIQSYVLDQEDGFSGTG